jgi:hypothetical protein
MGNNKPYSQLGNIDMPTAVSVRFSARFEKAQRDARRIQTIQYGVFSVVSLTACIASGAYLYSELSQTGVFQFVALAFQDMTALSYSKELGLSILESLPILGFAFLFATALSSGISVPRFVRSRAHNSLYAY